MLSSADVCASKKSRQIQEAASDSSRASAAAGGEETLLTEKLEQGAGMAGVGKEAA